MNTKTCARMRKSPRYNPDSLTRPEILSDDAQRAYPEIAHKKYFVDSETTIHEDVEENGYTASGSSCGE